MSIVPESKTGEGGCTSHVWYLERMSASMCQCSVICLEFMDVCYKQQPIRIVNMYVGHCHCEFVILYRGVCLSVKVKRFNVCLFDSCCDARCLSVW